MKQFLKQPLFYSIFLLVLFWFLMAPQKPEISSVYLSYLQQTEQVKLPLSKVTLEKILDFSLSFNLLVQKGDVLNYRIIPTGCIKKIVINDKEISLMDNENRCNEIQGFTFDFSPYLKHGDNDSVEQ